MKKAIPAQTIVQQIQPQCNTLHLKIKDAKDRQHETNQSIADHTGIPISNIAKFFSGSLASPSVFYVAAICIHLHLSLDDLMEIAQPKEPDTETNVAELQAKLDGAEKQIVLLKERSRLLEAGIAERKPIIYGLAGLCLFLSVSLMTYLIIDIGNKSFGFFRSDRTSVVGIVMIVVLLAAVCVLVAHMIRAKKESNNLINKRTDTNE